MSCILLLRCLVLVDFSGMKLFSLFRYQVLCWFSILSFDFSIEQIEGERSTLILYSKE